MHTEPEEFVAADGLAAMTGRVTRADGTPIGSARITVTESSGNLVASAVTAADGTFSVGDLRSGTYMVIFTAAGRPPTARTVGLEAGGEKAVGPIAMSDPQAPNGSRPPARDRLDPRPGMPAPAAEPAAEPAILVEGLTKSFGEVHALRGLDLSVQPGRILGVLGPTGPARRHSSAS